VPDAVNSGQVGVGIVIDFFAFSAQGLGLSVKFVYPTVTTVYRPMSRSSRTRPTRRGLKLSSSSSCPSRQEVLLEPGIRRLPVLPAAYAKAPAGYPNPFKDAQFQKSDHLRRHESEARTAVVDTLFDQLISFQLNALKAVTKTLHEVDAALARKDNPKATALAAEARDLIAAMPVDEAQASTPEIRGAFSGSARRARAS
jgi:hypothetical protein